MGDAVGGSSLPTDLTPRQHNGSTCGPRPLTDSWGLSQGLLSSSSSLTTQPRNLPMEWMIASWWGGARLQARATAATKGVGSEGEAWLTSGPPEHF